MQLTNLDWLVVAVCVVIIFAPALLYARRAGKNMSEFFASGQSAPWWLIGTSMVATTFATDTPGLVTQFVRENGVASNWQWWAFLLTGMATVFFYSRMWRRSGVLTDLEFYELRYSGKAAVFVRGFRAVYLGLVFNCFIMATVTLAAVKIANVLLGVPAWKTVVASIILCTTISTVSGLWGVLVSDLIQFGIALTGAFAAAYYALDHEAVGGLSGLLSKVDPAVIQMLPDFADKKVALSIFIIPLTIQWWSVWYPGAEPGGGSYIAQRILAAKDERHAVGATLWFNAAMYALRPWPWIIVALASMVVFPQLADLREAFPDLSERLLKDDAAYSAMLTFVPAGMLGLIVASLLAAFVSTISTHLNWGASYLVNDFYKRFITPQASQHHYIGVSRLTTALLMIISGALSFVIDSAAEGFGLLLTIGAGTGLIYLLRWYWWRINAWSEVSAMVSSFAISLSLWIYGKYSPDGPLDPHTVLITTVAFTSIVWIAVTLITKPAPQKTLVDFYKIVRPAGPGWSTLRTTVGLPPSPDNIPNALLAWVLGCVAVYSALFGTGCLIFAQTTHGFVMLAIFLLSSLALLMLVSRKHRVPCSQ